MEWHFYLMAAMYIFTGVMHFYKPKAYLKITPSYLPKPKQLIFWSGVAEVLLGIGLLIAPLKKWSIYGIVLMLFVFIPVHIYMIQAPKETIGVPKWFSVIRFPLQFLLIWWALYYL